MTEAIYPRAETMATPAQRPPLLRLSDAWLQRGLLAVVALYLIVSLVLPLYALLSKSMRARDGSFVGLANFELYAATPALVDSLYNSLFIGALTTLITIGLAFPFAYALTRTCMPGRGLFRIVALVPILLPSLLPGIGLVYLFGNQGLLKEWLFGASIYGPIGIVIAEVFYTFPHALMILITALSLADARLYEAAQCLRAGKLRSFLTVTLPAARYGLVSAALVVFTLVVTDFGAPKVIGGNYNVLAVDIYKQVVGQQNFEMGAVVGLILLVPAALAFGIDRIVQRRQIAQLSARSVPYRPKPDTALDFSMLGFCTLVSVAILSILGICHFASLVQFWPYNLSVSLRHYQFEFMDGGGWDAYRNSLMMAGLTAIIGTAIIFIGAYLVEKARGVGSLSRGIVQLLAMLPMAVPGLVLGLGYIFFFNEPANPFNPLYGTLAILVICSITHFYTVAHLTATTALKQIDGEFESVAASLKQPFHRTLTRVTVPVCLPTILDIAIYLFVNAMTTVSAVVFIYSTNTALASVAILNMDDAGQLAPAAAMGIVIFYTNAAAKILHALAQWLVVGRFQRWRAA